MPEAVSTAAAEATFKLIVVVGVEQIVLAVVLIVDDGFDVGEAAAERVLRQCTPSVFAP